MSGKVLIGGGTGFIGNHLVNYLKQKGYGTIIVSRMPGPQRISWTELAKNGIPSDVTAVVNLAGQNIMDPTRRWTAGFKQNVWTSRVNTTAALAEAISKANEKPKAFVSFSGIGIYPPSSTAEYTEEHPVEEGDFLSRLCLAWEGATLINNQHPTRTVIIRSGIVLGKEGGVMKSMWLPFYLGVGGPVASGQQFFPWIHVQDMVRLVVHSIETQAVAGPLNGVAPQIVNNKQFTDAFASALWRPAFFPVPEFALNIIFGEERGKIMSQGQKVIPKRVLESGFKYKFNTVEEACTAVVRGIREMSKRAEVLYKVFFIMCGALGLSPYVFKNNQLHSSRVFECIAIIIFCGRVANVAFRDVRLEENDSQPKVSVLSQKLITILIYFCSLAMSLIGPASIFKSRHRIIETLNNLLQKIPNPLKDVTVWKNLYRLHKYILPFNFLITIIGSVDLITNRLGFQFPLSYFSFLIFLTHSTMLLDVYEYLNETMLKKKTFSSMNRLHQLMLLDESAKDFISEINSSLGVLNLLFVLRTFLLLLLGQLKAFSTDSGNFAFSTLLFVLDSVPLMLQCLLVVGVCEHLRAKVSNEKLSLHKF